MTITIPGGAGHLIHVPATPNLGALLLSAIYRASEAERDGRRVLVEVRTADLAVLVEGLHGHWASTEALSEYVRREGSTTVWRGAVMIELVRW